MADRVLYCLTCGSHSLPGHRIEQAYFRQGHERDYGHPITEFSAPAYLNVDVPTDSVGEFKVGAAVSVRPDMAIAYEVADHPLLWISAFRTHEDLGIVALTVHPDGGMGPLVRIHDLLARQAPALDVASLLAERKTLSPLAKASLAAKSSRNTAIRAIAAPPGHAIVRIGPWSDDLGLISAIVLVGVGIGGSLLAGQSPTPLFSVGVLLSAGLAGGLAGRGRVDFLMLWASSLAGLILLGRQLLLRFAGVHLVDGRSLTHLAALAVTLALLLIPGFLIGRAVAKRAPRV
jgi:hypothetical protein